MSIICHLWHAVIFTELLKMPRRFIAFSSSLLLVLGLHVHLGGHVFIFPNRLVHVNINVQAQTTSTRNKKLFFKHHILLCKVTMDILICRRYVLKVKYLHNN